MRAMNESIGIFNRNSSYNLYKSRDITKSSNFFFFFFFRNFDWF